MKDLNIENVFILDLFQLDPKDIHSIRCESKNGQTHFFVMLEPKYECCPDCGFDHPKIKNYVLKTIKHSALSNRPCQIHYKARRYVCPICHRTYYEHNPFVFRSQKISTLTILNCLKDLKDFNETFTSVARRHHISPTSVCSIFDNHVDISRKKLPKVINFDEVYAFRSPKSKYVCVLLDFVRQTPIDILPDRKWEFLSNYFQKIPLEERENVQLVCFDMYDTYRSISKKYFPSCRCSIDKFHVYQEFHRKMNSIRIRVMKGCTEKDVNYYLLKKFNWLLFKDEESLDSEGNRLFDPCAERKWNRRLNKYCNYYELRELLLAIDNEMTQAYALKLEFKRFYKENNFQSAPKALNPLILSFLQSPIMEMNQFGRTLMKWKEEIINSFIIVKHEYRIQKDDGTVAVLDKKINNSILENRNKVIKCIKNNANGYTNWQRFRNRLMYVLNPNETFHLEPIERKEKK